MTAAMPNMPSPLLFTDARGREGQEPDRGREKKPGTDAARVCFRRRLLGLSVRVHVRGERGRGRHPCQKNGVTLLVDPLSFQYLSGAEIDYKEDLNGAQFVIKNPQAKTTCGCGSSFST